MSVAEERSRNKISLGSDGNSLVNLIVMIALMFIILKFIYVIYLLSDLDVNAYYSNVFSWFVLPAEISKLASRPWTILTFMFTHNGVFEMIGNVLWLWVFGYILQDLAGNRKLIPVFLYGGLTGAVVYIVSYYLIPKLQPGLPVAMLSGANPGVMAIAIATTVVSSDYRIFPMINGGIPLWIITLIYVIINFATISSNDPAVYLAHLGGAAAGFFFIFQMRKGRDLSTPINSFFDWVSNLFNPDKPARKKIRDSFFYKVRGDKPFTKKPNITQSRVDQILDKINQQGYHLLTDEEKDILRRAAEEDNL